MVGLAFGTALGVWNLVSTAVANYIRVNVFLDSIQYRDDWRNLMARFHESDARSLRAFVNREDLTGTFVVTSLGAVAGGVSGLIGGAVSGMTRTSSADKANDRDASR